MKRSALFFVASFLASQPAVAQFCPNIPGGQNDCNSGGAAPEGLRSPPPLSPPGAGMTPSSSNPMLAPFAGRGADPVTMVPSQASMGPAGGTSYYSTTDFTINTGLGPVAFTRYFTSNPYQWRYWSNGEQNGLQAVPKPFGAGRVATTPSGLRWSHSFFSMVLPSADTPYSVPGPLKAVFVRDTQGMQHEFADGDFNATNSCKTGPGWCPPSQRSASIASRLKRVAAGYEFYDERGNVLVYDQLKMGGTQAYYFLRLNKVPSGQILYEIKYAAPKDPGGTPIGSCTDVADPTSGAPYINTVDMNPYFDTGSGQWLNSGQLQFFYAAKFRMQGTTQTDCVISEIRWKPPGGTAVAIALYTYNANKSGDIATFAAGDGGVKERYEYDAGTYLNTNRFEVIRGDGSGVSVFRHVMNGNGLVTSTTGGGSPTSVGAKLATLCLPKTCCSQGNQTETPMTFASASRGDGSGINTSKSRNYSYSFGEVDFRLGPFLYRRTDGYTFSGSGTPGTEEWHLTTLDGGGIPGTYNNSCRGSYGGTSGPDRGVIWATKDKRNNYTITPHIQRLSTPPNAMPFDKPIELLGRFVGASQRGVPPAPSAPPPMDALESTGYGYDYGAWAQQRLTDVTKPSSAKFGSVVDTRTVYDGLTSRVAALITHGWTHDINGAEVERYRAIFFKTQRACTDTAIDPLARTVRIEGPCFVPVGVGAGQGFSATSCDPTLAPGGAFPVTELVYYPSGGTNDNNAGRLQFVSTYPNNTGSSPCGTPLFTHYASYDFAGLPLEVRDANYYWGLWNANARTDYTYENGRIATRTTHITGGSPVDRTTRWNYENGLLTSIQYPNGNYQVFCYRTGGPQCTGAWSRSLQWVAKASDAQGLSWSEKIKYEYAANDMSLRRELHYISGDLVPRFEKRYESDADFRPTWDALGSSAVAGTTVSSKRRFDGADNLEAIGPAFNSTATAFCGANPYACAWMSYDRANRLAQVDIYPSSTSSTGGSRTCIQYDEQGKVRRVAAGCASGLPQEELCPRNLNSQWPAGDSPGCTPAMLDYEVDDFGNTTSVTAPWGPTARGITRYEYDATNHVIMKQTSEMLAYGNLLTYTYDSIGRLTTAKNNAILLYSLGYDGAVGPEAGCRAYTNPLGRLTRRSDAFGTTAYLYDEEGRVTYEDRLRIDFAGQNCNGTVSEDRNPYTAYTYDKNGNVLTVQYPHGRLVKYIYDPTNGRDRIDSIEATTYTIGYVWGPYVGLISNIVWEPFGGLRAYKIVASGELVEYYRGGGLTATPTLTSCALMGATYPSPDGSGRLRGLFVSDNTASLGNPNGNVFKQVYKWSADMVVAQYTCHRNSGNVVSDTFGYNSALQLTGSTSNAAASSSQDFGYELRGNRNSLTLGGPSCIVANDHYADVGGPTHARDLLTDTRWGTPNSTACGSAAGRYNYTYDRDGRRTSTSTDTNAYRIDMDYAQFGIGAGLDSVYHFASLTNAGGGFWGGSYSYFYDAFGRRTAKTTPWTSKDEYFYDLGHQMLSDRGVDVIGSSPGALPEDDYIWLSGRPVVIIRGQFNAAFARLPDGYNWCPRNNVANRCSTNFPITDYLGKPVVMLSITSPSGTGGTAGSARYQVFGAANRREARYASPHYTAGTTTVMTINDDMPPAFDGKARVLFNKTQYGAGCSITLNGVVQPLDLAAPPPGQGGSPRGHAWSNWEYRTTTGWAVGFTNAAPTPGIQYGFDMEAYEIQMKQYDRAEFWTPLRFPGQYYDEETELHENWNRNYDPQTGRYLQPEPLVRRRGFSLVASSAGASPPVYSYALNNPVAKVDRNGLDPFGGDALFEAMLTNDGSISESDAEAMAVGKGIGAAAGMTALAAWMVAAAPAPSLLAVGAATAPVANQCSVTVSRWGRAGLQAGDWVMRGPASRWNYFWSGKWQPGGGNQYAPFSSGQQFQVPASAVSSPVAESATFNWMKNMLGQSQYMP